MDLRIKLLGFCIERALSEHSEKDGTKFIDYIKTNGSISAEKISSCLEPSMDLEQLNADTSCFDDVYFNEADPIANEINVSNIEPCEEDASISFDAEWVFRDFKVKDAEEALEALFCSQEEIATYMLQAKEEILVGFRLRNNRNSQPVVELSLA